ncbi:hypothetical protein [Tateyamaria sp.]|uniref:hypothetical protein n=1 Tax=Tateyamaria sp. TaxID=1929288 RepID=UPI00329CB954
MTTPSKKFEQKRFDSCVFGQPKWPKSMGNRRCTIQFILRTVLLGSNTGDVPENIGQNRQTHGNTKLLGKYQIKCLTGSVAHCRIFAAMIVSEYKQPGVSGEMKAIVHIGCPKVGSSSIQLFLINNAVALAKQGIVYKQNFENRGSQLEYPMGALTRMGKQLPRKDSQLRYKCRTFEEQKRQSLPYVERLKDFPAKWPDHVALFSSEHAAAWLASEELVREFDAMFQEVFSEVQYVAYFRAPEDLIVSQYSEQIKTGNTSTFGQFFKRRMQGESTYRSMERWVNVVGAERLSVRLLDRNWLEGGDLISDFASVCGFDETGLERPPTVNASLTASGAECLRALNRTIPQLLPDGTRNPLRHNLINAVSRRSANAPKLALTKGQRETVRAHHGKDLDWFHQTFFPNQKELFKPKEAQEPLKPIKVREMALDVMTSLFAASRMETMPRLSKRQRKASSHRAKKS